VVGYQNANAFFGKMADNLLNVENGFRVDSGKRLIEQQKLRLGGK